MSNTRMECKLIRCNEKYLLNKQKAATEMRHQVAQLFGVETKLLDSQTMVNKKIRSVTETLGLHIWKEFSYKFHLGVSSVLIISESHVAIHTWPEFNYAHIDIITCSSKAVFDGLEPAIKKEFNPSEVYIVDLEY